MVSVRSVMTPLLVSAALLAGCGSAEDTRADAAADAAARVQQQRDAELTDRGGVVVTGDDISTDAESAASPAEVVVYEDFQCEFCKEVDDGVGDYLEERMLAGEITVEYRIVSFLDSSSTNEFSSRAANAALCVFDEAGPGAFYDVRHRLYESQPAEGSAGPDEDALADYASDAGADVGACIANRARDDQVTTSTQEMDKENVTGTPTVLVDGDTIELNSDTAVEDAVEKAIG